MRDARRKPIAGAVLLGMSSCCSSAFADTVVVNSCNDPLFPAFGETPLRSAIALVQPGGIIDMSGLACSTITLEQGELVIDQASLGLLGPNDHELTIDAQGVSRAIHHYGAGDLGIAYLSATNGAASGLSESGGCIRSSGKLTLQHATLSHCTAASFGGGAFAPEVRVAYARIASNYAYNRGGGLASIGYLLVEHSDVLGNHTGDFGHGGGLNSNFNIVVSDSNISSNAATYGGALDAADSANLTRATISGNTATGDGGGVYARIVSVTDCTVDNNNATQGRGGGLYASSYLDIVGSTISGNSGYGGGTFSGEDTVIRNSTVVRNVSPYGSAGGVFAADSATIISSIVANNIVAGTGPADVLADPGYLIAYTSLIRSASEPTVSLTVDPRLGPLADHGGGRRTHAVLPGSPVINLGSNPLHLQTDERGLPRVVNLKPDIGAYERQAVDDQLLYDGFDSS
jgi:predicted outer membrane repeat protein